MGAVSDALGRSRLTEVIEALENREPVDVQRVAALQSLDLVMAGRAVVLEAMEREDQADEQFRQVLESIGD